MPVDLKVPEMGESVTEVYIGQWQKTEGDRVEQDDALVELESEKATLDLRAPAGGVLTKILKQSGDAAEVGEVIGQIDDGGEAKVAEEDGSRRRSDEGSRTAEEEAKPANDTDEDAVDAERDSEKPTQREDRAARKRRPKTSRSADAAEVSRADAPKQPKRRSRVSKPPAKPANRSRGEERVPMSPIRRRIAARLVEAQQNAALLTTFNEIDMSAVKELRAEHGEAFERRHKVRLGFMSFFVKAPSKPCGSAPSSTR